MPGETDDQDVEITAALTVDAKQITGLYSLLLLKHLWKASPVSALCKL